MADTPDRKLYLGPKLRLLRRELGLNQTQMAQELGVSPSYLNHLERNQRPLTAQMLMRLVHTYDIDFREFVAGANEASASSLHEIFADRLVRDIGIMRHEVMEVAENYPGVAEAMARLYGALGDLRRLPDRVEQASAGRSATALPLDWLRDFIESKRNHFAEIDEAAEAWSRQLGSGPEALTRGLTDQLEQRFGISTRIMPEAVMAGALRHYDFHRRRLMLSERLPAHGRLFGQACQFALESLRDLIDVAVERASPPDDEIAKLLRVALVNYAAAAIVMPYQAFRDAAEDSRHDLDLLVARFCVSFEQVSHRLTTLDRQSARGIPFFLLKTDSAGNVAKRFAIDGAPIARFGGGCPRWHVHRAFRTPGESLFERVETPDGTLFLTIARAVPRATGHDLALVVLGCEEKYAPRLRHADPLLAQAPTPIGAACHICPRANCQERSLPPVTRTLEFNLYQRSTAAYPFRVI